MMKDKTFYAPKIWGILNITPDSFSDGGFFVNPIRAYKHLKQLLKEGADYIDIGAASSRPNAEFISAEQEWQRLAPLFDFIEDRKEQELFSLFSIDTWRAEVAQILLEKNIFCINDISAFSWDKDLLDVLVHYKPYYVLMHCQGIPQNMQTKTEYTNIVEELLAFFDLKLNTLYKAGFPSEKIILDLGIGFGKNLEQNLALLRRAKDFACFGLPLMAAVSRKSWIKQLGFEQIVTSSMKNEEFGEVLMQEKEQDAKNLYTNIFLDDITAYASLLLQNQGFTHHRVHNVEKVAQAFYLKKCLNIEKY